MPNNIDLDTLFKGVSTALVENQEVLNQADTYNHDHGDNMVEIFRVITEAMDQNREADPADQLAIASEILRQRSKTGSGQMYADGLSEAANQFQGKSITPDNAMLLIQSLLGGGQSPAQQASAAQASPDLLGSLLTGFMGGQASSQPSQTSQGQPDLLGSLLSGFMGGQSTPQQADTPQAQSDMLGSLLSGLMGGQSTPQQTESPQAQPDLLGSLLSGVMGGQSSQQKDDGFDMGDLMSAGLAFLSAKQQGKNSLEAIINAIVSSSQGGQNPYRAQSSALVVKTLLQMLGSSSAK